MAARTPTSFDLTYNEELLRPRKPILAATPDAMLDNQERLVDMPRVVFVDVHNVNQTGSSLFTNLAGTYYLRGRDTMGTGTITDARGYVLCRSQFSGAVDNTFEVRITIGATNYDLNVANGDTTWTWRLVSSAITLNSDETEETMDVAGRNPAGVDIVLVAGVFLATV